MNKFFNRILNVFKTTFKKSKGQDTPSSNDEYETWLGI